MRERRRDLAEGAVAPAVVRAPDHQPLGIGRLFQTFAVTIGVAILVSGFVSLTLTPMLCSRFLKLEHDATGHAKSKSGFFYRLVDRGYGAALRLSLRYKLLVVLVTIGVIASTVPIATLPASTTSTGSAALYHRS